MDPANYSIGPTVASVIELKIMIPNRSSKVIKRTDFVGETQARARKLEPSIHGSCMQLTRFTSNKVCQTHQRWDRLLDEIISDHERRRTSEHWRDAAVQEVVVVVVMMISKKKRMASSM